MAKTLKVEIVGDSSSLEKSLKSAGSSAHGFGSALAGVGKMAALVAGGAALGGLAVTLKVGIGEWMDSTKVAAQTAAVLKSTGGVANITAQQVDALSGALLRKSGVDDEAIKSGENMLLTFKNIRNEAGKGNDIFNQTTSTLLDMTTALTHGNVTSEALSKQAIQLGKAMNDPIAGLSALKRVGVTFTDGQKEQIAALVKSGHAMEAQKIILHELNSEFGGSAKAMGQTLPGQIGVLRESFNNLAGDLVGRLAPAMTAAIGWTIAHLPDLQNAFVVASGAIGSIIQDVLIPAIGKIVSVVQDIVDKVKPHWESIKGGIETVKDSVADLTRGIIGFGEKYQSVFAPAAGAIVGLVIAIKSLILIEEVWTAATAALTAAQYALDAALTANPIGIVVVAVGALVGALVVLYTRSETTRRIIDGAFSGIRSAALAMEAGVVAAFEGMKHAVEMVKNAFEAVVAFIRGLPATMRRLASEIGAALVGGIVDGVKGLGSALKDKVTGEIGGALSGIKSHFGIHSPSTVWRDEVGKPMALGVIEGWTLGIAPLGGIISDNLSSMMVSAKAKSVASAKALARDIAAGMTTSLLTDATNFLNGQSQAAADNQAVSDYQSAIFQGIAGINHSGSPDDRLGPASQGAGGVSVSIPVTVSGFVGNDQDLGRTIGEAVGAQLRNGGVPGLSAAIRAT